MKYWSAIACSALAAVLGLGNAGAAGLETAPISLAATPNSFSFSELTNVELGKTLQSSAVTITGLTTVAPISIIGGEYSIAGGAFTTSPGTIRNGQTVQVRTTAPTTFNTSATVTLTVGTVSASLKISTPSFTAIKAVTDILQNNDPVATVDKDGILNVTSTPAGPLVVKPGAVENGVIRLATTGRVPFTTNVNGLNYTAVVPETTLRVMPIPNTDQRALELALGVIKVTADNTGTQISLQSNSTWVSHLVTSKANQSFFIARDPSTRTVAMRIDSGSATIKTSPAGTTNFTEYTLYSGETVVLAANGQVASVRLGSNGRDESLCGDPITLKISTAVTVPKLNCSLERLGGSTVESLVSTALGKLGLSVQSVSQSTSSGIVTLVIGGRSYRYLPIGDIQVDAAKASANQFAASSSAGTYQLAASGITLSFATSLASYDDLLTAAKKKDATASMKLLDGGLIWLSWQNAVNILQAGAESTTTSNTSPTLELATDGYYRFTDSTGAQQVMYPAFASTDTVTTTFQQALADVSLTVSSNGNGSATASSKSGNYKLTPDYAVGTAATSHLDELWWSEGGKLYIKYADNTAQAFGAQ